jgi:hypothetical protein
MDDQVLDDGAYELEDFAATPSVEANIDMDQAILGGASGQQDNAVMDDILVADAPLSLPTAVVSNITTTPAGFAFNLEVPVPVEASLPTKSSWLASYAIAPSRPLQLTGEFDSR